MAPGVEPYFEAYQLSYCTIKAKYPYCSERQEASMIVGYALSTAWSVNKTKVINATHRANWGNQRKMCNRNSVLLSFVISCQSSEVKTISTSVQIKILESHHDVSYMWLNANSVLTRPQDTSSITQVHKQRAYWLSCLLTHRVNNFSVCPIDPIAHRSHLILPYKSI